MLLTWWWWWAKMLCEANDKEQGNHHGAEPTVLQGHSICSGEWYTFRKQPLVEVEHMEHQVTMNPECSMLVLACHHALKLGWPSSSPTKMSGMRLNGIWPRECRQAEWTDSLDPHDFTQLVLYRSQYDQLEEKPKLGLQMGHCNGLNIYDLQNFIHWSIHPQCDDIRRRGLWEVIRFRLAFLVFQTVKNLPAMQETQVWSLGQEDPLEKKMATHSSILAWRIPRTEEPGGLQSMG